MIASYIKKIIFLMSFVCIVCVSFGMYYYSKFLQNHAIDIGLHACICEFNPLCDTEPILNIFKNNWHALVEDVDYSPEFMMQNRTPDNDEKHFGILVIKVIREKNKLAAFTAYYMKTPEEGIVLFLAVDHNFRGKRYGYKLMQYALKELKYMGAKSVGLWVLINNIPARKIYRELGFIEKVYDERESVYLEYNANF
ncbi:MAG TPA: GNAT family N-acetyltransferase [Candidatus Babeliales bacterium]|nr:GNAT family N-acetyltransferase [Candidatus Babeliales bacterium]